MRKTILLVFFMLVALSMETTIIFSEVQEPVIVSIEELGISIIEYKVDVLGGQTIDCIGQCLFVLQLTPENAIYFVKNNTISLISQTDNLTTYDLVVVSQIATPINNNTWIINTTLPYDTLILLPIGSVPININPTPTNITLVNQRLALYVTKGNLTLTYTYIIEEANQTQTTPTTTNTTTQATKTNTTTQGTVPATNTNTTKSTTTTPITSLTNTSTMITTTTQTTPQPITTSTETGTRTTTITKETTTSETTITQEKNSTKYMILVAAAIIIAGIIYYLLKNRGINKPKEKLEEIVEFLDERDRSIISLLREKGAMQPSEMLRELDMPRSAFYRRINRLRQMGLIEQISLKGKTYYKLKETE